MEKDLSDKVKKSLSDEQVPELIFPAAFSVSRFSEKVVYVKKRIAESPLEIERDRSLALSQLAQRWMPIYRRARTWIEDRLALLSTTTSTFETRMCFFINGWMPTRTLHGSREN